VFKGTYRYRLDGKGRLPVPPPFRRGLAAAGAHSLVVTLLDECLAAYAPAEWARLEARLVALPPFSKPVKGLTRLLASRAVDCDLDVQGRILLPLSLRTAAALAREATVVGVLNRFEVWSSERWAAFLEGSERMLEDVSLGVEWPLPPPPRPQGKSSR
jgi:transcriptional regulator MraZ